MSKKNLLMDQVKLLNDAVVSPHVSYETLLEISRSVDILTNEVMRELHQKCQPDKAGINEVIVND